MLLKSAISVWLDWLTERQELPLKDTLRPFVVQKIIGHQKFEMVRIMILKLTSGRLVLYSMRCAHSKLWQETRKLNMYHTTRLTLRRLLGAVCKKTDIKDQQFKD